MTAFESVLREVGDGYQERVGLDPLAVNLDGVAAGPVAGGGLQYAEGVTQHPPALGAQSVERIGHLRVETDARDVQEGPALDFPDVDSALAASQRDLQRSLRLPGDPQFPRQAIARPGADDPKRRPGADELGCDFIDRAVAAPGDDDFGPVVDRPTREFGPVARTLGQLDATVDAVPPERLLRQADALVGRQAAPPPAGYGIDDDDDGHRRECNTNRLTADDCRPTAGFGLRPSGRVRPARTPALHNVLVARASWLASAASHPGVRPLTVFRCQPPERLRPRRRRGDDVPSKLREDRCTAPSRTSGSR